MANTVPFEKSKVKNYLRRCVLHWRVKDAEGDEVAKYYIDAFQSVSMSLFGETIPTDAPKPFVNHCNPVNGVHAPFCNGDHSARG